jgi:hypothetical protein
MINKISYEYLYSKGTIRFVCTSPTPSTRLTTSGKIQTTPSTSQSITTTRTTTASSTQSTNYVDFSTSVTSTTKDYHTTSSSFSTIYTQYSTTSGKSSSSTFSSGISITTTGSISLRSSQSVLSQRGNKKTRKIKDNEGNIIVVEPRKPGKFAQLMTTADLVLREFH